MRHGAAIPKGPKSWRFHLPLAGRLGRPLLRQFPNRTFAVADDGAVVGIVSESDLAAHPRAAMLRDALRMRDGLSADGDERDCLSDDPNYAGSDGSSVTAQDSVPFGCPDLSFTEVSQQKPRID